MSIPISQFIPLPLPPDNHRLFSISVTLFLLTCTFLSPTLASLRIYKWSQSSVSDSALQPWTLESGDGVKD